MGTEFQGIALLGRHTDARIVGPMTALAEHLTRAGYDVSAAESLEFDLPVTRMPEESLCDKADLAIAIGGDGEIGFVAE